MCEILVSKRKFRRIEFYQAWQRDGLGVAVIGQGGNIRTWKCLRIEELDTVIDKYSREARDGLHILHARLATRGNLAIENVQPFVDKARGRLFAHNGDLGDETVAILKSVAKVLGYPGSDDDSDTLLLWVILQRLSWDESVELLGELSSGQFGQRFVLAEVERAALFGHWEKRGEIWTRGYAASRVIIEHGRETVVPWVHRSPYSRRYYLWDLE
ncbi:class II glutamine amidotransferase [Thermogutta sp.]|uniref:class II glutamine amidotransferase n=1 Tax=Thermogutta sp. TaxID=1962930 RepID=UPI00321FB4A5